MTAAELAELTPGDRVYQVDGEHLTEMEYDGLRPADMACLRAPHARHMTYSVVVGDLRANYHRSPADAYAAALAAHRERGDRLAAEARRHGVQVPESPIPPPEGHADG